MDTRKEKLSRLETATQELLVALNEARSERDHLRGQLEEVQRTSRQAAREQSDETATLIEEVATLRRERENIRQRLQAMEAALDRALASKASDKHPPVQPTPEHTQEQQVIEELSLL